MSIPFRKKLGFRQSDYAFYLGVSDALVSLKELGLRTLTGEANGKEGLLILRWLNFEKTWTPPPPDPEELEEARIFLKGKLMKLTNERNKRMRKEKADSEKGIDYRKSYAFLQNEVPENEDEMKALDLVKLRLKRKVQVSSLMYKKMEELEDRFLDFQIAEYQRELDALGPEPPQ